jgi:hypothetical protein
MRSEWGLSRCVTCQAVIPNTARNPCDRCRLRSFIAKNRPQPEPLWGPAARAAADGTLHPPVRNGTVRPESVYVLDDPPKDWDWGPDHWLQRLRAWWKA